MKRNSTFLLIILGMSFSIAQSDATIKEIAKIIKTYPYSDPNRIAQPNNYYYPYFRFDEFASHPIDKEWNVVELENDFIKISILPEIGGKIWGAIEKSKNQEFIYSNSVVKFRDIAMRGAWTSGGIEFNFGIIGHAPTCATPVDYVTKKNPDGSVSCFIGATDFFTQTRWETEVNLPKDKAYFTTNTIWHNKTPLTQPYYQWMNAAYQVEGDLEFSFPGSNWIGHDGAVHDWPMDDFNRDLSFYRNNNFGESKSYHVIGGISDFYAAYWHEFNFGSGHYAPYGEKLGMKVFLWEQSRAGGIWEDLLTDGDGQYVELQSGRLFNQAIEKSTKTPFKHFGFLPYEIDTFKEYWFPVLNSKGVVKANEYGALNVEKSGKEQTIYISPIQEVQDNLKIYFNDELQYTFKLDLDILESWERTIDLNSPDKPLTIILGDNKLIYSEKKEENRTGRPMIAPKDYDWNSTHGLYTDGLHWMYQNEMEKAEGCFLKCLEKDKYHTPALNQMAALYFRKGNWAKALEYSKKSLSINTYDAEANFIYGLANKEVGKLTDAQDGFSVASLSPSIRNASEIELSKYFLLKKNLPLAKNYAKKVVGRNSNDLEGNLLMAVIFRKEGNLKEASKYVQRIKSISPLNHHANFEYALLNPNKTSLKTFFETIKNEMPHETVMDISDWYSNIGYYPEAIELLKLVKGQALVQLKLAYLYDKTRNDQFSNEYLETALTMSTDFVFPYRKDNLIVLEWAVKKTDNWKPKYYLALLNWSLGNTGKAEDLFSLCSNEPDTYYFYLSRTILLGESSDHGIEKDLLKAYSLGKSDWRTSQYLIEYYLNANNVDKAIHYSERAIKLFPLNNKIKYCYAKSLLAAGRYKLCRTILEKTTIIPSEGARSGRLTYRQACLMEAIDNYKKNNYNEAIALIHKARKWPENLGAGKPYDVDETSEDFLEAQCLLIKKQKTKAQKLFQKIIVNKQKHRSHYDSTDYLYLKAMEYMSEPINYEDFFAHWTKTSINNIDPVLQWCKYMVDMDYGSANKMAPKININTGGTPWNPLNGDTEFKIVESISKILMNEKKL